MSFFVIPARTQEGVLQIHCVDGQCTAVMVVLVGKPLVGNRTYLAAGGPLACSMGRTGQPEYCPGSGLPKTNCLWVLSATKY